MTPELQADDVYRLLTELGGEPADVFGSSGGAVVGLALVTAHPGQVRTLVAHEPPVIELLPDREQRRAEIGDIYDTYGADGPDRRCRNSWPTPAWATRPPWTNPRPRWEPSPAQIARMRASTGHFLAHLIRPTTSYQPDIQALQAASTRILVGAGTTSRGQLAHRTAVALATELGTPVVEFPGDHGGFLALPEQFGRELDQVLTRTA